MKLYTRTGDDGSTQLFTGQRLGKDALRVETFGTVDELNATLGLAAAACRHHELTELLRQLQTMLFELGGDLASLPEGEKAKAVSGITDHHVQWLENQIDQISDQLPQLKNFILPGGGALAAHLHHARTIARRAERLTVALAHDQPVGAHIVPAINRLSDLLFAMARRANQLDGIDDVPWKPAKP